MISFIDYFLISLVLFVSLYLGKFISIKAKEEVDSGLFWFKLVKLLVYFSIVGYVAFSFGGLVSFLILIIGFLGYNNWDYLFLAFAYSILFDNVVIGLIFVYGLLKGTVTKKLFFNIYFVVVAVVFFALL